MRRPRLRRAVPWAAAWLILAGGMAGAHAAVWVLHLDGAIRPIANAVALLTAPAALVLDLAMGPSLGHASGRVAASAALTGAVLVFVCRWMLALTRPARTPTDAGPADPSRRAFLARGGLGVAGVGISAGPAYATLIEPWDLRLDRVTVPIAGLAPVFDGMRVVQITDTHIGPRIPRSFVASAVRSAIGLAPDLIVLTGDYVSVSDVYLKDAAEVFAPLIGVARFGVLGVLGNHDHWVDGPRMSALLTELGVRMIDNDRVFLDPRGGVADVPPPAGLAVVGLGDLLADRIDPDRAFRGVPSAMPRLVLAHHPDTAELPAFASDTPPRIDLMLSGHTHGGQVRIPFLGTPGVPSDYGSKYASGLVQGPGCRVYVSCGVGMSVFPVRFGVPPEIGVVTLRRAQTGDD